MDSNTWTGIIIGMLLSVPVGFFVNLFTPRLQNWWNKRKHISRAERCKKLQEVYDRVKKYHDNPQEIILEAFRELMRAILPISAVMLAAIMLSTYVTLMTPLFPPIPEGSNWAFSDYSISQWILFILFVIMAITFCFSFTRVYRLNVTNFDRLAGDIKKLLHFEEFEEEIQEEIKKLSDI